MHEPPDSYQNDADKISRDRQIRALALAALHGNPETRPCVLRVGVKDAVVHLGGQAPDVHTRSLAESITAGLPGVRGVVNRIEAPGGPLPARPIHINLVPPFNEGENQP